jgi:carbonic anhydrase/acetyltransferase-like protein (isoleucine patch superfamily)
MPLYPFDGRMPAVDPSAWVAPGARVVGDVTLGAGASVWYNCVLRGDVMPIRVGARSNIQDGTVVHVTGGRFGTVIGDDVLVGHSCMIHGCELQDRAFVGLGAIVMDGCVVEPDGMVAAGALLTPGKLVRARELWAGQPAKLVRLLGEEEVVRNRAGAAGYVVLAGVHRESWGGESV